MLSDKPETLKLELSSSLSRVEIKAKPSHVEEAHSPAVHYHWLLYNYVIVLSVGVAE